VLGIVPFMRFQATFTTLSVYSMGTAGRSHNMNNEDYDSTALSETIVRERGKSADGCRYRPSEKIAANVQVPDGADTP
jgi:hypothetical protein